MTQPSTPTPVPNSNPLLLNLRRVILAAPDHLLHMRWVESQAPCGTAFCAFGWALQDPWFQANTKLKEYRSGLRGMTCLPYLNYNFLDPLHILFSISEDSCDNLFALNGWEDYTDNPHIITKAEVLWNIDQLLLGHEAFPYQATLTEDELRVQDYVFKPQPEEILP